MRNFQVILAMDSKRGIGKNGTLPWRIKKDMDWFKKITTDVEPGKMNAVIMGRKTWESIPAKFRPLPNRLNIVLSRTKTDSELDVLTYRKLEDALSSMIFNVVDNVFVIGGAELYNEALNHPCCKNVFVTEVDGDFDCDIFVDPIIDEKFEYIFVDDEMEENGIKFRFCTKARFK